MTALIDRRFTLLADQTIVLDYDIVDMPRESWLQSWWCLANEGCHADVGVSCPCGRPPILAAPPDVSDDEQSASITLDADEQVLLIEACSYMQRLHRRQGHSDKAGQFAKLYARLFTLGD